MTIEKCLKYFFKGLLFKRLFLCFLGCTIILIIPFYIVSIYNDINYEKININPTSVENFQNSNLVIKEGRSLDPPLFAKPYSIIVIVQSCCTPFAEVKRYFNSLPVRFVTIPATGVSPIGSTMSALCQI